MESAVTSKKRPDQSVEMTGIGQVGVEEYIGGAGAKKKKMCIHEQSVCSLSARIQQVKAVHLARETAGSGNRLSLGPK